MVQGATLTIAAGQSQAVIVATFPSATYQATITPGWVTGYRITAKGTGGVTVDFDTPAPPDGSTFQWLAGTPDTPNQGATQTIAAGATTATIAATLAGDYQVAFGPAWLTAWRITSKTGA